MINVCSTCYKHSYCHFTTDNVRVIIWFLLSFIPSSHAKTRMVVFKITTLIVKLIYETIKQNLIFQLSFVNQFNT